MKELLYGCQDGRLVQLLLDADTVRQGFVIQGQAGKGSRAAVAAIHCGADYSKVGLNDLLCRPLFFFAVQMETYHCSGGIHHGALMPATCAYQHSRPPSQSTTLVTKEPDPRNSDCCYVHCFLQ